MMPTLRTRTSEVEYAAMAEYLQESLDPNYRSIQERERNRRDEDRVAGEREMEAKAKESTA